MQPYLWLLFGITVITIVAQVWLDLRIPEYMSAITEEIQSERLEMLSLGRLGGCMILCAIGSMCMAVLTCFVSSRLAASFSMDLRDAIFRKVENFSKEEMDCFSTASLITRSTNDVVQLQNFTARGLRLIVQAPIMAGMAFIKISGKHWQWTAVAGGCALVVMGVVAVAIIYAHPRFRRMQVLTDELNRVMRENLTGMRVIRAYNAENIQEEKFEEANERLTENAFKARAVVQLMNPITRLVNGSLTIAIYCIGAFLILDAAPSEKLIVFTDMVVFSTYASKIIQVFTSLNHIFNMYPRAMASAQRVFEVLEMKPGMNEGTETRGIAGQEGTIEFDNVCFSYPGANDFALDHISFRVEKGEMLGIIGSTASGKTTLVNLIVRLYDAVKGRVLVDGVDVRSYQTAALRARLAYVPQQAVLLTGTVASNVSYGDNGKREPTEGQIKQAVEIAQAEAFVEGMKGGIHGQIQRGGSNVSGGQKQRLAIARAICRSPEIYIFDDAFSALDYKTDRELRLSLKRAFGDATIVVVASRIATIRDADQILVMEEGRIAAKGTHRELLHSCNIYREIARTQLPVEEWE